ncbi:MAG: M24 family metallopeptidase, partial [Acidimicrobiia bacterium]
MNNGARVPASIAELPSLPVAARAGRVRERLAEAGVDALVLTNLRNIRYLTGFTGSAAVGFVLPDRLVLLTDGRYRDQASIQLAASGVDAEIVVAITVAAQAQAAGPIVSGLARLGLEADHVSWSRQRAFAADWFPDAQLVPTSGIVEAERAVKDTAEVARIAHAASIADEALRRVAPSLGDDKTEREIALALDDLMRQLGAEGPSFDTIVASGPNSAMPHHQPGGRRILEGDLVVCDFGALVDGYASDMTRTFVVGDPSSQQREMLELVCAAEQAGVDAVRAGAAAVDIDRACREVIVAAGRGEQFSHGTGHGLGLDIHEIPFLGTAATATLAPGNVITVEPGV